MVPEIITGSVSRSEKLIDGEQACLDHQRVERRFRQEDIDAASRGPHLLVVGGDHLIEGDLAWPGSST